MTFLSRATGLALADGVAAGAGDDDGGTGEATGKTTVFIVEDAAGEAGAGRDAGLAGAAALPGSTTVATVEDGFAAAPEGGATSAGSSESGSGKASLIARAEAGRFAISCSSACITTRSVWTETAGASSRTGGKLKGGASCGSRPVSK